MGRGDLIILATLHRCARSAVFDGDVVGINNMYYHVDEYNLEQLITLLRTTSVYKTEIVLWTYAIVKAYELCKIECILPRKELWGLI